MECSAGVVVKVKDDDYSAITSVGNLDLIYKSLKRFWDASINQAKETRFQNPLASIS